MNTHLESGELPVTDCLPSDGNAVRRNVSNVRYNLLLRQQRNEGAGYLLDHEAEYLLALLTKRV